MKNIEKYKYSKAALDAYNRLDFKREPFDVWLECEDEEPPKPTLLEAAEAVVNIIAGTPTAVTRSLFRELRLAVEREKAKTVRNCDKYKTAKEAYNGFKGMCNGIDECKYCRFRDSKSNSMCPIAYLYDEAEKEAQK